MSTETLSPKPAVVSRAILSEANARDAAHNAPHHDKSVATVVPTEAIIATAPVAAASLPTLLIALKDSDADVAREAAASLGTLGNAAAVDALVDVLENSNGYFHSVVRVAAIHSLGQLRDARAIVPLLSAIKDPIAEASAEAIRALASMEDPRTLAALLEVVRNEHGFFLPETRRAAILGLAQIGGKQADCELQFVANNPWEDGVIRATAIELTSKAAAPAVKA